MSIVKYYNSSYLSVINGGISTWQGIRYINENIFLICGTTNPTPTTGMGIIYSGNIFHTPAKPFGHTLFNCRTANTFFLTMI